MWHKRTSHTGPNGSKKGALKESQVEVNKCARETSETKNLLLILNAK